MVEVGNYVYILVIVFAILLNIGLYFLLKNKSKKLVFNILLVWCFCGFALHFLKQLNYMSVSSLRKSTAENICAVSTLVFPFIMLHKKQGSIHDFMFLIGFLGGAAALIYPTEAIGKELFTFDCLRFYFCHISLLSIPLQLALHKIYVPKLKNFWKMPIYFLLYELIICLNTAFLLATKLATVDGMTFIEAFLDKNKLNNSFVFGPTDDMGVAGRIIGDMCPNFMKVDIFNLLDGKEVYWPVIWLTIPSFIVFVPLYILFVFPFHIGEKKVKNKTSKSEILNQN